MSKRKPEWIPEGAGPEYASRVMSPKAANTITTKAPWRKSRSKYDLDALQAGILSGDRATLSRAITLIESNSPSHFAMGQELIKRVLPHTGSSTRIGITGVPGAGKSTFIESFGCYLISQGKKVAVLAIDPSSSISQGSILGDKTRMEKLSRNEHSFIRPSPSSGVLGGVARKTRESMLLCEAAGYDTILIETVGVGQSETTVRSMVDIFMLIQIAGAGDELQGIKKGIMELSDLIIVNKADGDNIQAAKMAKAELDHALHYIQPSTKGWQSQTLLCSALEGTGLDAISDKIDEFIANTKESSMFLTRRKDQVLHWFDALLDEAVLAAIYGRPGVKERISVLRNEARENQKPVVLAVQEALEELKLDGY